MFYLTAEFGQCQLRIILKRLYRTLYYHLFMTILHVLHRNESSKVGDDDKRPFADMERYAVLVTLTSSLCMHVMITLHLAPMKVVSLKRR